MALTDIARQLKKAFPLSGYEVVGLEDACKWFRSIYHDAETIRIGEMDYIVINGEYRNNIVANGEYDSGAEERQLKNVSPLFYNSINNPYAIIDEKNSSTLINEVYSRVTYMRRKCKLDITPQDEEVRASVESLVGKDLQFERVIIPNEGEFSGSANIFQCHLIKDTGVSATSDSYNFMIKNGEIRRFSESEAIMRQMNLIGGVEFLKDSEIVDKNRSAIQSAVFERFDNESEIEIQSITVKSIFEIALAFRNVKLWFLDSISKKRAIYDTSYFPSGDSNFDKMLNTNIHTCNCCGRSLVDSDRGDAGESKRFALHLNTDALCASETSEDIYAIGCEDCLEKCPVCGEWHFNYDKFIGTNKYDKIRIAPHRGFIRGLRSVQANYCACREGIEWIYDEKSGNEKAEDYDIIPVTQMAFVNYADERVAGFEECLAYYKKLKKRTDNVIRNDFSGVIEKFKNKLAAELHIDADDIKITSIEKCKRCSVCGGEYYTYGESRINATNYRCHVCDTMAREQKKMVTRTDGVIFMRHRKKLNKYLMNRFGNLKLLSSQTIHFGEDETETAEAEEGLAE